MKEVSPHESLACNGSCIINNKLLDCATEHVEKLGLQDISIICRDFPDVEVNELIQLYNGALFSNKYLYFGRFKENKSSTHNAILQSFEQNSSHDDSFCLEDVFLSFHYIESADAESLEKLVSKRNCPPCLLQASLLESIWKYFDRGVAILLRHGASPVEALKKGQTETRPLQVCMHNFCEPYLNAIIMFPPPQRDIVNKAESLTRSLQSLLFTLQDSPFRVTSHGNDDSRALQEIYQLAVFSLETVEMLIDIGADCFSNDTPFESPIAYAFEYLGYDIENSRLRHGYPMQVLLSIFANGIVPLLRAGSRQNQLEPLHVDFGTKFGFLLRMVTNERPSLVDVFCKIIVETRSFKAKPLMCSNFLHDSDEFQREALELMKYFPCSLQNYSRRAVVAALPYGLKARNKSIDLLPLPSSLKGCLKYKEFDAVTYEHVIS